MRHSKERGAPVRNVSTELTREEHCALKEHARKAGKTLNQVLRELVLPIIARRQQEAV